MTNTQTECPASCDGPKTAKLTPEEFVFLRDLLMETADLAKVGLRALEYHIRNSGNPRSPFWDDHVVAPSLFLAFFSRSEGKTEKFFDLIVENYEALRELGTREPTP